MKVLLFILCIIGSLISVMSAFKLINQPSWLSNAGGAIILYLVFYSIAKTKFFTQFKKKINEKIT